METVLPQLGEGAESGTVVEILVKEGDTVEADQPLIELENEKAVAAIPSPAAGRVAKIHVETGQEITPGQVIATIEENEAMEKTPAEEKTPGPAAKPRQPPQTESPKETPPAPQPAPGGPPPAASPSIRKTARDLGIDLNRVRGSGRGGRILLEDLRAYIQSLQNAAFAKKPPPPAAAPKKDLPDFTKWGPVRREKVTPLRKTIAGRMSESWKNIPRVTQFGEADITDMMALKKKHGAAYKEKDARLTLTCFIIKALVKMLRKYPVFNASFDAAAGEIIFKEYYHLGIAADTEEGLLVPVLRDADKKTLLDTAKELAELASKARSRKLDSEEMRGGTFTISNQGGIGGAHFTPVINYPETALLGVGRGEKKPAYTGDNLEPRLFLPLALSFDHRLIDGAQAARFITALIETLEKFPEEEVKL